MAHENRSWGFDRIVGALANLGYRISDQTVGNTLQRHGIPPAPERKMTTTWQEVICTPWDMLMATGFFTSEAWTWWGLVTTAILCVIHVGRGKVHVTGMMRHLHGRWRRPIARYATRVDGGFLSTGASPLHDRDGQDLSVSHMTFL
jgi:putative transposase